MKRKTIALTQKIIFSFSILFALTNCSLQDYAPKRIRGYEIQVTTTKASQVDERYLKNTSLYSFKHNGSYTVTLGGNFDSSGDYSYVRKGRNKADIVLTFNDSEGEATYGLNFTFVGPSMGTWTDSYSSREYMTETGTFTIVKRDGH